MRKSIFIAIATLLAPAAMYAVDGVILINQATVNTAGGFPYKITQPGSYKLAGNLTVPAGLDGIDINADHVTLDLNGFTIAGGGTSAGNGVSSTNSRITVKNGSVTNFTVGVFVVGRAEQVMDVHADSNGFGISVVNAVVTRCTADSNAIGIFAPNSTVIQNFAENNNVYGLELGGSSVYGSNAMIGNGTDVAPGSGVSQNNNVCTNGGC